MHESDRQTDKHTDHGTVTSIAIGEFAYERCRLLIQGKHTVWTDCKTTHHNDSFLRVSSAIISARRHRLATTEERLGLARTLAGLPDEVAAVTTVARAALSKLDLTARYTVVAKPSTPLTPVYIEQQTIGTYSRGVSSTFFLRDSRSSFLRILPKK